MEADMEDLQGKADQLDQVKKEHTSILSYFLEFSLFQLL
jgi:hypothetical protein